LLVPLCSMRRNFAFLQCSVYTYLNRCAAHFRAYVDIASAPCQAHLYIAAHTRKYSRTCLHSTGNYSENPKAVKHHGARLLTAANVCTPPQMYIYRFALQTECRSFNWACTRYTTPHKQEPTPSLGYRLRRLICSCLRLCLRAACHIVHTAAHGDHCVICFCASRDRTSAFDSDCVRRATPNKQPQTMIDSVT
jgi:hypothetical protein